MREIKFRAWVKDICNDDKYYMNYDPDPSYCFGDVNGCIECAVELGYILMQYTGLKDKNGVEIYEGDILKHFGSGDCSAVSHPYGFPKKSWKNENFVIEFQSGFFYGRNIKGFISHAPHNQVINGWDIFKPYDLWNLQSWCEKIGNIYENPELLEKVS